MFKIGTLADWFGVGLIEGIKASERCGAQGVQIYAWDELSPKNATPQLINQVKATARDHSQEIVALCGELGGHGLEVHEDNGTKIEYLKRVVDLAIQLDCSIVTTHVGVVPEATSSDKYKYMCDAMSTVGRYAEEGGVYLAIETGPEPITRLKSFATDCEGYVGINYDPGNLVMVTRDDEVEGVYTAGQHIYHTHAKDGVCHKAVEPKLIYDIFADGGIEALSSISTYFTETPLGEGEVRWEEYLKALREIGYSGYLTIEREVKENAARDIEKAVVFLREAISKL